MGFKDSFSGCRRGSDDEELGSEFEGNEGAVKMGKMGQGDVKVFGHVGNVAYDRPWTWSWWKIFER